MFVTVHIMEITVPYNRVLYNLSYIKKKEMEPIIKFI